MPPIFHKKILYVTAMVSLCFFIIYSVWALWSNSSEKDFNFSDADKKIDLIDNGVAFKVSNSQAKTIEDFLKIQGINLGAEDTVFPGPEENLYSSTKIIIQRAKKVSISADNRKIKVTTLGNYVESALWDGGVSLGEDDLISPKRLSPISGGEEIKITRVEIKEVKIKKDIPFNAQETTDDKLSWRIRKITQKGQKGIKEITYKVVSYDGIEISRKALSEEILKEPITEIATQGTYVKLGKAKTGQGTWYAFKGGLFAASLTIPRGAYAKVTNRDNGKSVIVQINDAGPYGKGRIIDLDKVAFAKIADLGTGVINVKVEQVLN